MAKYNQYEKKEKVAAYRLRISPEVIDAIYEAILRAMIVDKKYRDPDYTAKQLATDIHSNTRYVSAAVSLRFNMNFSELVNGYRVREAAHMLTDRRYKNLTVEQIATACGFRSRQSFHATFYRTYQQSPRDYQRAFEKRTAKTKEQDNVLAKEQV